MSLFRNLRAKFNLPVQFWVVALIAFINSVSFTIIIPILYPYAKEFGLSDFQASLLTTAYAVSQFVATPLLGRLSDVMGRKPLLVMSLVGTVAANLLASWTTVAWLLFGARILDGITGGNNSIARAVISDTTSPAERPKAFGLFDAAFRMGFVTGPAISYFAQTIPPLPGVSSLGMSFFAGAVMAAIATGLTVVMLKETLPRDECADSLKLSWKMFGLGKILGSIRRPCLGQVFLLTFLSGFTFTIFTFAFQPFFLNVLGQDAQTLAILFMLIGVIGVLTQVFAVESLTKRFNLADIMFVAIAGRGVLFLLMPALPNITAFVVLIALLGVVNAFPMPLISSVLSTNSGEREQGEVMGINASYLSISNAIGPATAGLLVSISYSTPFWVAGVLTLLTAAFALHLKRVADCGKKAA